MTRFLFGAGILAGAMTLTAAFADDTHDKRGHDRDAHMADFAAMHAAMCKDMYAHEVGRMAYLEAKLSLSAQQQLLLAAWKDVKLQSAQGRANACASMPPPSGRPDPIQHLTHEETMLQARLASLQAEMPALTALYQSLSPDQKRAFEMHGHHHTHGGMGGMWMHHGMDGGPHPGPDGMPPRPDGA